MIFINLEYSSPRSNAWEMLKNLKLHSKTLWCFLYFRKKPIRSSKINSGLHVCRKNYKTSPYFLKIQNKLSFKYIIDCNYCLIDQKQIQFKIFCLNSFSENLKRYWRVRKQISKIFLTPSFPDTMPTVLGSSFSSGLTLSRSWW